jgi:YD repeat-containing protein
VILDINTLNGTVRYQFDQLGRLTQARYTDGAVIAYAYDAVGNRKFPFHLNGGYFSNQLRVNLVHRSTAAIAAGSCRVYRFD